MHDGRPVLQTPGPAGGPGAPAPPATQPLAGDAEALGRQAEAHLEAARRLRETLTAATEPHTIANTLEPYDEIAIHLDAAANLCGLLERVHPDAGVRAAAERWTQEISQFATQLSLDRKVYDALAALDLGNADEPTRHYVARTLRDFRRAGVDRDAATRARVQALNDELTLVGQEFARNIQSDRRTVALAPAELEGLPADYIAAHPPGADGRVVLTTDYPDYVPFMSYARSGRAREAMYRAFRSRAVPSNLAVLDRMLARRHELATLLGYRSWAHYITEDKMIATDTAAIEFVERIAGIAAARAAADAALLLERKRQDEPGATEVFDWEKDYYDERVRAERFQVDSQAMRPYFPYERVKEGVLAVTAKLFGVTYHRIEDAGVWAADVETYDVLENGELLGRFHLDMHPRDDKYKHAAEFGIRNGVGGRQLPEAVLVCNFPGGTPGDPGLMEHDDVNTFFHEFGHLLHSLFAGRQRWIGVGGISTEWDFVEAPSQMLEEWAWDPAVLRTFAHHYQTGEPIPDELVLRARRARDFGKGIYVRQQMFYAMLSLRLHAEDAVGLDTTAAVRALQNEFSMFRYVEDTFFQASFGHLDGYSAIYYTYMWSLVIAKDLFSRFDPTRMLAPEVARAYRTHVLEAGGSAPAAELVQRFLGRPFSFAAYERWLNAG
jgi:thimet oligopeptidase